jgi:uncharacterized repeat protein (TIGR03803 family)
MKACGVLLLWAATAVALPAQTTTVSRLGPTFTVLYSFCSQANCTDGYFPDAAPVQATDGNLYGTTPDGGAIGGGTVFKITPGGVFKALSFHREDGLVPRAGLAQAADGNLFGTTQIYGANDKGTIFKLTLRGRLTPVYSFCLHSNCTDGAEPYAGLVYGTDRKFYGTTSGGGANGVGTVFKITPSGTLTTLHSFDRADGYNPYAGLVQGTDGNLYGTTQSGGTHSTCYFACGTVFRITPKGALTTLHSFCSPISQSGCPDGSEPSALVQATDGNFYGTTYLGGANKTCIAEAGCGTIFKITPNGTLTTIYNFCLQFYNGNCTDGSLPSAGLVQGTDGNFYGTTERGGANTSCFTEGTRGCGTVFEITPSGTLTTLYSFCAQNNCADGTNPLAGLVQDTNGKFYGATVYGGDNYNPACGDGCGAIFTLSVGLGPFVETQPTSGYVNAVVNILGTSLTGATTVTFNGTAASFRVNSPSEITTIVPTGATTGAVQVVTPGGTLSSNVPFTVN